MTKVRACKHGASASKQTEARREQRPCAGSERGSCNPTSEAPTHREATLRYLLGTMPAVEDLLPLRKRRLDWAALLKRVHKVDLLQCPRCHGKMLIIPALSEPSVVARVLSHIGLPTTLPRPAPARALPLSEQDLDQGAFDLDAEMDQRAL